MWSVISRGDGNVSIQPMTSLLIVTSLDNAPQINKRRCCRRCRRLWSGTRPGQGAPRTGSKLINGAGWTARRQQVNRRRALTRPYTTRQLKLPRIVPSPVDHLAAPRLHLMWCSSARNWIFVYARNCRVRWRRDTEWADVFIGRLAAGIKQTRPTTVTSTL